MTDNRSTRRGVPPRAMLLVLMLLLVHLSLAGSLSLGQLPPSAGNGGMDVEDAEGMGGVGEVAATNKRDGRRITRGRYRMGYMFGKRSGAEGSTASLLIKSLIGKAMSVDDLTTGLQTDPGLAERVARHLDRNGDGYVAVSELL